MNRWFEKLLRKLLGYTDYDIEGHVYHGSYRRRGSEGLIDIRLYLRPGEVAPSLYGKDFRELFEYLQARLVYEKDEKRFGLKNYWLTPAEYEEDWTGDCEDSALWLGSALSLNSIKFRVVLGCHGNYWERRKKKLRINHAWIQVWHGGKWWILETTSKTAMPVRADKASKYVPRISFDSVFIYSHDNAIRKRRSR